MNTTDITERGLELLIASDLTGLPPEQITNKELLWDGAPSYGGCGYVLGNPTDYDRDHALDLATLLEFLRTTQPRIIEQFALDEDTPERRKFLARLQGEITKRGTIDVLRKGIKHGPANVDLFYGTPSPGNQKAKELFDANIFSVTRQLQYSKDETQLALDLCLFMNGLPIATFELKNRLTKQTVEDAVQQYKRDRNPNELLFRFGRCMAHFAMDDQEVRFCTHLNGENSWFLPLNKGYNDGAGNPPNPSGIKTDYLWRKVLTREGLTDIIENYAQVVEKKDERTGKKQRLQIFPRYHQLDVVRKLLADVQQNGVGKRYLIQHSAGSGKSYSITWLSRQLMEVKQEDKPAFDSVIVVTDRRILDSQIRDNIKQFTEVSSTVGHAKDSGDLRRFLLTGKKIIITTIQKFPFILDEIGNDNRASNFAILIDEAHSSQGGRTAAQMNIALSERGEIGEEETVEDIINRIMEARKMLSNASYFAFTATPKNKTLEI
ncbi:MAG: type I restriction endonuclease subunit R, partial [Firmicutes bacterium]|nr:type I restriction endonuclease subunit R [Bacillota bacterium]